MNKMLLMSLLAALICAGTVSASDNQPVEETTPTVSADQETQAVTADSSAEAPADAGQDQNK